MQMIDTISEYFKYREEVAAVYLFGSYAQGKTTPSSDLDLAILFESHRRAIIFRHRNRYLLDLSRRLRKDLHLVVLNFAGERLLGQVFSKGMCISANNPRKLAEFKLVSYARMAEFGFYQEKIKEGFIRNIRQI